MFHVARRELEQEESSGNFMDGHRELTAGAVLETKLVSWISSFTPDPKA
jgi:hypothetical protein